MTNGTLDGLVLRHLTLDDDRLLTLLTPQQGVITAVVKRIGRNKGRMQGPTELFCHTQFQLTLRKERYTVEAVELIDGFFALRRDLDKLAYAAYLTALAYELAPRGEAAQEPFALMVNALHLLAYEKRPAAQLKAVVELRLLTLAGYAPALRGCAQCGASERSKPLCLVPAQGVLLCADCAQSQRQSQALALTLPVLQALRHVVEGPFRGLFDFRLGGENSALLAEAAERMAGFHIDKRMPALEFLHTL